jgi:hypothetical protein
VNTYPPRLNFDIMRAYGIVVDKDASASLFSASNTVNGARFVQDKTPYGVSVRWLQSPRPKGSVFVQPQKWNSEKYQIVRLKRFHDFSDPDERTAQLDVEEAIRRAKASASLLGNLGNATKNQKTDALLREAFGIGISDANERIFVKKKFESCAQRMGKMLFVYTTKQPPGGDENDMKYGAWVLPPPYEPFKIFVSDAYFKIKQPELRSALLIHEVMHKLDMPDHPGKVVFSMIERTPLGVASKDAVRNPYCYQYFAEWCHEIN